MDEGAGAETKEAKAYNKEVRGFRDKAGLVLR